MFVKVNYFGFYPLGSDIEFNHVKIMQSEWNIYKKPVFTYGKKNVISPLGLPLFYIVSQSKIIFFVAFEYGLGHYHIFTVSDKQNKKLSKKIKNEWRGYCPIAVHINKIINEVHIYGRVASGPRDMNFKVADTIFKLIDVIVSADFTEYIFTNDGNDRFYLDVYNPSMMDESELFILIGKADKIVWHWESVKMGKIRQEYRLLDSCVELMRSCSGETETIYYH